MSAERERMNTIKRDSIIICAIGLTVFGLILVVTFYIGYKEGTVIYER